MGLGRIHQSTEIEPRNAWKSHRLGEYEKTFGRIVGSSSTGNLSVLNSKPKNYIYEFGAQMLSRFDKSSTNYLGRAVHSMFKFFLEQSSTEVNFCAFKIGCLRLHLNYSDDEIEQVFKTICGKGSASFGMIKLKRFLI